MKNSARGETRGRNIIRPRFRCCAMSFTRSVSNSGEGVHLAPDKLTKYEWGRTLKKPEYWEDRKFLVWACPECDHCHVRGTRQKTANRYYGLAGKCERCGKSTRNILKGTIRWLDRRDDAEFLKESLNEARGKR